MLFVAAALAQEVPAFDPITLPYVPGLRGDGLQMRLVEPSGKTIRTDTALTLLGRPEDAERWRTIRRNRLIGAIGLWSATGVAYVGGAVTAQFDPEAGILIMATMPVTAVAGVVVFTVNPKKQLGGWVDREPVEAWIATQHAPLRTGKGLAEAKALYEKGQLFIDYDGVLVDSKRRVVHMNRLMRLVDDPDTEVRYRAIRQKDKAIWITSMAAGGAFTLVGAGASLTTLLVWTFGGDPGVAPYIGIGGLGLGLAGVGIGTVGYFNAKDLHEDPFYYYDEATLRGELDAHDAELRRQLGLPAEGARLELHPIVGPGVVGVAGRF